MQDVFNTDDVYMKLNGMHINLEKLPNGDFKASANGVSATAAHESLAIVQLQDKFLKQWSEPNQNLDAF